MVNKHYQKHKERLQKEVSETYQNLKKKNKKDKKKPEIDIKIFLKNKRKKASVSL